MFAKLDNGNAVCLEDYKDIKKYGQVPPVNELWEQVEEYVAANGWSELPVDFGPPKSDEQRIAEIGTRLSEIDKEAVRPTRSIKVAELAGTTPSQFDIDKLTALEDEAQQLRTERGTYGN